MQKNILTEINRVREIMGLRTLIEQEVDTEQEDVVAGESVEPNAYQEIDGGQPYELFLEKATPPAKLYLESSGEETTISQKFMFRKKHKNLYNIEVIEKKQEQHLFDNAMEDNWETINDKFDKRIEKQKELYQKSLANPKNKYYDKEYQYTSSKDNVKNAKKSGNPYEKNPAFVEGAFKLKVDIPLTAIEKVELMEEIQTYVNDKFGGDYDAAADTKKRSKKTKYTRYYGIEKIVLSPKDIKTIKAEKEKVVVFPGLDYVSEMTDQGNNSVFPDNEWVPGDVIKDFAQGVIDDLNTARKELEQQGYKGVTFEMTSKGADENGSLVEKPFTISTSASRIPNGGKARDLTFLELSEKRAKSTAEYLKSVWGSAGIKMIEPEINFQGDGKTNKDGSTGGASGPEWDGNKSAENRQRYESSKYCNITCLIKLTSPGFSEIETPATPKEVKVGDWHMVIKRRMKGRPVTTLIEKIKQFRFPRIRLPKLRWPRLTRRKRMPCYGVQ